MFANGGSEQLYEIRGKHQKQTARREKSSQVAVLSERESACARVKNSEMFRGRLKRCRAAHSFDQDEFYNKLRKMESPWRNWVSGFLTALSQPQTAAQTSIPRICGVLRETKASVNHFTITAA